MYGRGEWDACLAEAEGEGYEVLNAEALRTEFEDRICDEGGKLVGRPGFGRGLGANKLFQGIAESFPALSEGGFYYCLEEFLVTAQAGPAVAFEADDGGFDLRRRAECALAYGEEILDVIPGLEED